VKFGRFKPFALPAHLLAHLLGDRWHVGQPFRQSLEVEASPAHEDRQLRALDSSQDADGIGHIAADGEVHGGIYVAIETVWSLRLVLGTRPGRDHPQVAVDLHGIGVDHHAVEGLCQSDGQCGLA
jgi:hypothetical protein